MESEKISKFKWINYHEKRCLFKIIFVKNVKGHKNNEISGVKEKESPGDFNFQTLLREIWIDVVVFYIIRWKCFDSQALKDSAYNVRL